MPVVGALVVKEFQTWLRGRLTFAAFTLLVVLVALLVFLLGLLILAPDANAAPALFSTTPTTSSNLLVANRALFLFGAVSLCVVLAAGVVAPTVAASAFAGERERGTLDLLLLQGPGAARIVLGKVFAALIFSLLLLLVAQGAALFLLFGTLGLHLALTILAGNDALKPLLWLNPFLDLLSGGGAVTETFARGAPAAYRAVLALPPQMWAPGVLLPAWLIGSLLWTVLAMLLVFGAAIAIDPCHPLKGRRAR